MRSIKYTYQNRNCQSKRQLKESEKIIQYKKIITRLRNITRRVRLVEISEFFQSTNI